ncbi:MAG: ferritin-like domain-containing protein, partial [Terriglobia bacterium]
PISDVDPVTGSTVTFEDLTKNQPPKLQANLIMPEPCEFINKQLPACAIIRPTGPGEIDAVGAIKSFIADGLFFGHPQFKEFTGLLLDLAEDADEARRET